MVQSSVVYTHDSKIERDYHLHDMRREKTSSSSEDSKTVLVVGYGRNNRPALITAGQGLPLTKG
jgi:hypothetical protein